MICYHPVKNDNITDTAITIFYFNGHGRLSFDKDIGVYYPQTLSCWDAWKLGCCYLLVAVSHPPTLVSPSNPQTLFLITPPYLLGTQRPVVDDDTVDEAFEEIAAPLEISSDGQIHTC